MCTLRFPASWCLQTAFGIRNSRCSASRNVYRYTRSLFLSRSLASEQYLAPYIGILLRGALSRIRLFSRDYINLIVTTEPWRSGGANEDPRPRTSRPSGFVKIFGFSFRKRTLIARDYSANSRNVTRAFCVIYNVFVHDNRYPSKVLLFSSAHQYFRCYLKRQGQF